MEYETLSDNNVDIHDNNVDIFAPAYSHFFYNCFLDDELRVDDN